MHDGRKHLNFSEWEGYEAGRKIKKLKETEEEVGEGEMPMAIYLPMHPEAKLSEADRKVIVDWAKQGLPPAAPGEPTPAPAPAPAPVLVPPPPVNPG